MNTYVRAHQSLVAVAAGIGVAALAVVWIAAGEAPSPIGVGRAAPADSPNGRFFADGAQFAVECGFARSATIDPIVHPGSADASHRHDFFGSTAVGVDSVGADLVGTDTTCRQQTDTASYWAPSLLRQDGTPVEPLGVTAYYRVAPGVDPEEVRPFPLGLAAVAGDGRGPSVAGWGCGRGGEVTTAPQACPATAPLDLRVTFPDCWDGDRLDSPDHRSHLAYSGPEGCDGGHPVALPRLTLVVRYPVHGDPDGLALSSGDVGTAHADFLNGWEVDALAREVTSCLHHAVVCGIPESSRAARAGQ